MQQHEYLGLVHSVVCMGLGVVSARDEVYNDLRPDGRVIINAANTYTQVMNQLAGNGQ